ncbi:unnamed protein product [Didymodactylos carnosus]|uniref:Uncharacterized protein n=1 Tax=Didymodactylos carnosus TaxID=1234261 RepID=A0A8S2Y2C2_9BILA|nr:unnamed protein product [Didymodactylos carnosus]CAF4537842.1 unnamed protein product [Didymodactylos carnosus]
MYTDLNEQMDLNVPFEQFKQADESASYEQQKRKRKPRPSAYEKINQQLRQLDKTTNICSSAIVCNSAVDTFRACK